MKKKRNLVLLEDTKWFLSTKGWHCLCLLTLRDELNGIYDCCCHSNWRAHLDNVTIGELLLFLFAIWIVLDIIHPRFPFPKIKGRQLLKRDGFNWVSFKRLPKNMSTSTYYLLAQSTILALI